MRTRFVVALFLIAMPAYCMELPCNDFCKEAYDFLVTNNSSMEKREAALHLNILISLMYNAAYDHICSLFDRSLPVPTPIKNDERLVPIPKKATVIKASEIALNAYAYATGVFWKTINADKIKIKRLAFDKLDDLFAKEIEILNKRYKPAMKALRDLDLTGECSTYPESISFEHFLLRITGCKSFSEAVTSYDSST